MRRLSDWRRRVKLLVSRATLREGRIRQAIHGRRLFLEPLENRSLLATITVTSLTDGTLASLAGDGKISLREAI